MIIWVIIIVCIGTGSVAFDSSRDPLTRWMAFGIMAFLLLVAAIKWIRGELEDD